MLLGQKVKCVFPEKHSHQNCKWTVSGEVRCCWTNEDPFGEEHSNPLPKCTCHKTPHWNGSLKKTNILCNPQGGNDSRWGWLHRLYLASQGKILPARGHEVGPDKKALPEEPKVVLSFSVNENLAGKRHSWWNAETMLFLPHPVF